MDPSGKLIVALDVPELKSAEKLVKALSKTVRIFKIGKELFTAAGPAAVEMVHSHKGRVFLDLKFHDIPNTVGAACEAAVKLKVFMLNVHASGGRQMMTQAVQAVTRSAQALKTEPPLLIGVTVLTSMKDEDLMEVGVRSPVEQQVESLALLAKSCGLDGVVASAREIPIIRKAAGPDLKIVTPGVRPVWAAHGDQKRVMTPREAVQAGADYIVVGRPITEAQDPPGAAKKILEELNG